MTPLMPGAMMCLVLYGAVAPVTAVLALRQSVHTRAGLIVMAILVALSWLDTLGCLVYCKIQGWRNGNDTTDWRFMLYFPFITAIIVATVGCVVLPMIAWDERGNITKFIQRAAKCCRLKVGS